LNVAPTLPGDQTALAQPVDEKPHGKGEKQVGDLVYNQSFRFPMGLGGMDRCGL
jgi:hypothetical protein